MPRRNGQRTYYDSVAQREVPHTRNGKHRAVVARIMDDLAAVNDGRALRIPLDSLGDTKENVRSALNRETRKRGMTVATAADTDFLYIWNESAAKRQ